MSLAENDAWKNSTPNCFTRCAGTVIIGRVRLRGDGVWGADELANCSRCANPCQHVRFGPVGHGVTPRNWGSRQRYPQDVGSLGIRETLWIAVDEPRLTT